jgi:formylmethanofuran dehydrogenase subunit E-like metal-binding protein
MPQTIYQRGFEVAFPGQLGETSDSYIRSLTNTDSANLPAGVFVKQPAVEDTATNLGALADIVAGVTVNVFAREPGVNAALSGAEAWVVGASMPVMDKGAIWVLSEEALAVNDTVYARVVAHVGVGIVLGAIRNDADTVGTDTCRRLKGARVLKATYNDPITSKLVTLIYFDAAVEYAASVGA